MSRFEQIGNFNFVHRTSIPQSLQIHSEVFALVLPEGQFGDHQGIFEQILSADQLSRTRSGETFA